MLFWPTFLSYYLFLAFSLRSVFISVIFQVKHSKKTNEISSNVFLHTKCPSPPPFPHILNCRRIPILAVLTLSIAVYNRSTKTKKEEYKHLQHNFKLYHKLVFYKNIYTIAYMWSLKWKKRKYWGPPELSKVIKSDRKVRIFPPD